MRDYSRIRYYIDSLGQIWHGPFSPYDTMHYKKINEIAVNSSNLPKYCVEITAYQAAQELERNDKL